MKFIIDMNLSPRWVSFLFESGITSNHWSQLGARNAPDWEIMAHARAHDYAIITHDLDFCALLAETSSKKPSVVQIRADDVAPSKIGSQVIAAIKQMEKEITEGALLTIELNRNRIRILPL